MSDVIATWEAAYGPVRRQVESITVIARGKGLHQPLGLDSDSRKNSAQSNQPRRTPSGLIPGASNGSQPRALRIPSTTSLKQQPSPSEPSPAPSMGRRPDYLAPTDFTTATILGGAAVDRSLSSPSPGTSPGAQQARDYFGNGQIKKKPPPPPPPKRIPSTKPEEWVVALYSFAGQGQGDLSFREGDRIKIVKKTGTDQDWWVGELNGVQGSFPANYCKMV